VRARLPVVAAFLAIYIIWGSTYLAIGIAVATVPPFLAAGLRFVLAGAVLLLWSLLRRTPVPSKMEWRNLAVSAALLFVPAYGGLFWAEKVVPSGIASVMVASIPIWMTLMETFVLKQTRLHWSLAISITLGVSGVALLALRGQVSGAAGLLPYVVLFFSQISWCIGTLFSKNMRMPSSKPLTAGAQMAMGGLMLLTIAIAAGELHPIPVISLQAWMAILYLASAGSVVAFTAYLWLLGRMPATVVASYAYVNPVVALALGWWLGHEVIDARVVTGAALVLCSVVIILRKRRVKPG
jgi:drug/metabolite transporter (DMT)-like permease